MGRRRFEVGTTLRVAPEQAIDFLMDLTRHGGLHPFLSSADVVATGHSPEGPWWDWSVLERVSLGPFRYPIRFRARTTRTSPTSMTVVVRAAPGCRLRSTTVARAMAEGCRLVEVTEVSAPWLLVGYMAHTGEAAHARTYRRLPDVLS